MTSEESDDFFHYFIKRNFPIISIIGIFLAISKYFSGNGSTQNDLFISLVATIFAIFLLCVFVIDSSYCMIKRTQEEFKKPILEFILAYLPYIAAITTLIFVCLLVSGLIFFAIQTHPFETNLIVFIIELFVGILLSAVAVAYIFIQIKEPQKLVIILIISVLSMFFIAFAIDIFHKSASDLLKNPNLQTFALLWLLPIVEFSFVGAVIKLFSNVPNRVKNRLQR
jgi:drug/metabolite transporter (DMT)-like permease